MRYGTPIFGGYHSSDPAVTPQSAKSMTELAQRDGVRTLYRFMRYPPLASTSLGDIRTRQHVLDLIQRGELYFASPGELNDPFEAAPHVRVPEGSPDERFAELSRLLREVYAQRLHWSEAQIAARECQLREEIAFGIYEVNRKALEDRWRSDLRSDYFMSCFSAVRDSILMWSYYASGHTGVCLHFDAAHVPFASAQRVHYSSEYPAIEFPAGVLQAEKVFEVLLLTKSEVWKHEREYRILNAPSGRAGAKRMLDDVLRWKSERVALLDSRHLEAVTIGAAMGGEEIESIARACHDRPLKVALYRARTHASKFKLEFERIT